MPRPFEYPQIPHVRRHGPQGYSSYQHYRNWLRDEFTFRCVYCLRRETWLLVSRDHSIDHFLPKSVRPDIALAYDNLVYACSACNGTKAAKFLPSPEEIAYGECMSVNQKGEIRALNDKGTTIIEALYLDADRFTRMRKTILTLLVEARPGSETLKHFFGFPEALPDLSSEPALTRNSRPPGIAESYWERKKRGQLPEFY